MGYVNIETVSGKTFESASGGNEDPKSRLNDGVASLSSKSGAERRGASGAAGSELLAEVGDIQRDMRKFIDAFGERQSDKSKTENFAKWVDAQSEPESLRRAGMRSKGNRDNYLEKFIRLAAQYLVLDSSKSASGKMIFKVDFKGNELAEWKLGAGYMLPPTADAINVYDESGALLFSNAKRAIVAGKVGYFSDGKYAYVHTGYRIEVLKTEAPDSDKFKEKRNLEDDLFDQDEKKTVVKVSLQRFFSAQGMMVAVDDDYFDHKLGEFEKLLPSDWWDKYNQGKLVEQDFFNIWKKSFSQEDFNLMRNIAALKNLDLKKDAQGSIDFSDFDRVRSDAKFAELKSSIFDEKVIRKFQRDKLKDVNLGEVLYSSSEIMAKEPFVEGVDHFGGKVILRKNAMVAFQKALRIAQSLGVQLKVNSSYRSVAQQEVLYREGLAKHGAKNVGDWVAAPTRSNHLTGGTVDVVAYVNGVGGNRGPNQKLLWKILPAAGFVNYEREPWHWEIYSERWRKKTGNTGPIYSRELGHTH